MKMYLLLNQAPWHKDILGSGGIAPRILLPQHKMEVSGQLHALATLPPQKRTSASGG